MQVRSRRRRRQIVFKTWSYVILKHNEVIGENVSVVAFGDLILYLPLPHLRAGLFSVVPSALGHCASSPTFSRVKKYLTRTKKKLLPALQYRGIRTSIHFLRVMLVHIVDQ